MRFNIYALSSHASRISARTPAAAAEQVPRPFLPGVGRACRQARGERGIHQVQIAAAIRVNQATIPRFGEGTVWPRRPVRHGEARQADICTRGPRPAA